MNVPVGVAEALGAVGQRGIAITGGGACAVPFAVPREPEAVHLGAELDQQRERLRGRGPPPLAQLGVELAGDDALHRVALVRPALVEVRSGHETDEGDGPRGVDALYGREREANRLGPVVREVRPGDRLAGEALEAAHEARCGRGPRCRGTRGRRRGRCRRPAAGRASAGRRRRSRPRRPGRRPPRPRRGRTGSLELLVAPGPALEAVLAGATDELVLAGLAEQPVLALAAQQPGRCPGPRRPRRCP